MIPGHGSSSKCTKKKTFKGNRFTRKKNGEKLTQRRASLAKLGERLGGASVGVDGAVATGFYGSAESKERLWIKKENKRGFRDISKKPDVKFILLGHFKPA